MKTCRLSDGVKEPLEKYIDLSIGQTMCTVCNTNTISQFSFHCGHVIAEKKRVHVILIM